MITAVVLSLALIGNTLAASIGSLDFEALDELSREKRGSGEVTGRPPYSGGVSAGGYGGAGFGYPAFNPYGYASAYTGNFGNTGGFPNFGSFPQLPQPFFPFPYPTAPMPYDFNSIFSAYINALQSYTQNLQTLQQNLQNQQQQQQQNIAARYADSGNSPAGPSYFVGTASGGSTNPGQISVSAPPGAVVQHFEGPGGLQGVSVSSGNGFAGGATFGGGGSGGAFGGASSSSFGGAPFSAGTGGAPFSAGSFGSGGGAPAGVFTSSSSGSSSVNGQTETFHQSTTGHVNSAGQVSSITVSKP